jgi:hypothetical protein
VVTKDTGDAESRIKSHEVLFEHYPTIAYKGANPFRPEYGIRDMDSAFGGLLTTNLDARILDIGRGMGQFLHYGLQEKPNVYLGDSVRWSFERTAEIPREKSGKTRLCIMRVFTSSPVSSQNSK